MTKACAFYARWTNSLYIWKACCSVFSARASFTGAQRALSVRGNYWNNNSTTNARRKFCSHYNIRKANRAPTTPTIQYWERKIQTTGSTLSQPRFGKPRTSRELEIIERVRVCSRATWSVQSKPVCYLKCLRTSLNRIPHEALHYYHDKIQIL